jgi:MoaA/NifB/PqqE/SkfB family radical SAM enzyme
MNSPLFCFLAFKSVSSNSFGQYIPCCGIQPSKWEYNQDTTLRPKEKINSRNLQVLRQDLLNGVWPAACENCRLAEESNGDSMRIIWNNSHQKYNISEINPIVNSEDILHLDLTFETKCNSKCMTCNPSLSSFWETEYSFIYNTPAFIPQSKVQGQRIHIDSEDIELLVEDFPNVESISFIGGEPTISEMHVKYLKRLIDLNRSKNISLSYVTNLTGINEELLDLWDNFNNIHLTFSIDGYGKINEYIRYPFTWQKTEQQVKKLFQLKKEHTTKKFTFTVSCTVSLLNFVHIPEFFEYFHSLCKEYDIEHSVSYFLNRVTTPEFMQLNLLPLKTREQVVNHCNTLMKRFNQEGYFNLDSSLKILSGMAIEPEHSDSGKLKEELQYFINKSDLFRNRNIKDFIPDIYNFLNEDV